MKRAIVGVLVVSVGLLIKSCDTTDPPDNKSLSLKLEDVSCTEAWIELTTTNLQLSTSVTLKQTDPTGNTKSRIFNLNTKDSLLYIDSLLPNKTYQYQASRIQNPATSNELSVSTMDTTSHNFNWQTFEFGVNTNQSHLFDVAIINENNIWAVGEILVADTSINGYTTYNSVHWDGSHWELKRITVLYRGSLITPPLYGIFAFSDNEIWLSSGVPIKGDGTNWTQYHLFDMGILTQNDGYLTKIWGTSSADLYYVGTKGTIARYINGTWSRIESGTELALVDMTVNNSGQIYICGGNPSYAIGIILKSEDGNNFSTLIEGANILESQLFNPYLYGSFSSILLDQNNTLYSGGNILFRYKIDKWEYVKSLPENFIGGNPGNYCRGYITRVRGNSSNDMWIAGDRNTLRHFNGLTWQQIGMPYNPQIDLVWRGIACNNDNLIAVGTHDRMAIIMKIKR